MTVEANPYPPLSGTRYINVLTEYSPSGTRVINNALPHLLNCLVEHACKINVFGAESKCVPLV